MKKECRVVSRAYSRWKLSTAEYDRSRRERRAQIREYDREIGRDLPLVDEVVI